MHDKDVARVLTDLANGVDPNTGRPFPENSPYHQASVIRALFSAASIVKGRTTTHRKRGKSPDRAGEPWSREEDARLRQEFNQGASIVGIAGVHKRTSKAILARLGRLGLASPADKSSTSTDSTARNPSNWLKLKADRQRAGRVWTAEDDEVLIMQFEAGDNLDGIAKRLQRGLRAVEVRLFKLGKLKLHTESEPTNLAGVTG